MKKINSTPAKTSTLWKPSTFDEGNTKFSWVQDCHTFLYRIFVQTRNLLDLRLIWWRVFLLSKNMLNAIGLYPDGAAGLSLFMDFLYRIQTFLFVRKLIRKTAYLWLACVYITSKLEILDNTLASSCRILLAAYALFNLEVTTTKGNFPRKAGISFTHFRENLKNYRTSQGGSS